MAEVLLRGADATGTWPFARARRRRAASFRIDRGADLQGRLLHPHTTKSKAVRVVRTSYGRVADVASGPPHIGSGRSRGARHRRNQRSPATGSKSTSTSWLKPHRTTVTSSCVHTLAVPEFSASAAV